jgi:hypothetical protein
VRGRGNSTIVEEGTLVVVVLQIVSFFRSPLPTQGESSGSNSFQRPFHFINKGTQKKKHLNLLLLCLLRERKTKICVIAEPSKNPAFWWKNWV